jgi:hypothetical protein
MLSIKQNLLIRKLINPYSYLRWGTEFLYAPIQTPSQQKDLI